MVYHGTFVVGVNDLSTLSTSFMYEHTHVHRRDTRLGLCAGVPAGAAAVNAPADAPADGSAVPARPRTIHDARRRTPLTYRQNNSFAVARSLVARFSCHAFVPPDTAVAPVAPPNVPTTTLPPFCVKNTREVFHLDASGPARNTCLE